MRVLYVSHTGTLGGAEQSLLELLDRISADVEPCLVCPEGELAARARASGVPVVLAEPISVGFGATPQQIVGGLVGVGAVATTVARVGRRFRCDLVHANSVRAGLAAIAARAAGAPPPIVHVRDVLPSTPAGRAVRAATVRGAALVLANSRFTAAALGRARPRKVQVVYNGIDLARFDGATAERDHVRHELGIDDGTLTLGVVAQLTPWKGQEDALRILERVRHAVPDAHLLLAGEAKFPRSTRYDNAGYAASLKQLAATLGLNGSVRFVGERRDVPRLLSALDILLVPSWEEPFGRTVLEAMAAGTAVVATANGGPAEILDHGETGVLLPPRDPERWANEVVSLWQQPERRRGLVCAGRAAVERFTAEAHAARVLEHYRRTLAKEPVT